MTHTEHQKPGSFCWVELGTTDQQSAKQFYSSLFSWTSTDVPMGPSGLYTLFHVEGHDAGAAYTLNEHMRSIGVPPHWMLYILVESADAAAAKAKELGGKVEPEPFDVADIGRMAVIQDPTGVMFSVWQPRQEGRTIYGGPGTFCWADLYTPDNQRAIEFYSGLFGWEIAPDVTDPYFHIKNGDQFIGGMPPAEPTTPPHWMIYFKVDSCEASTEKAKELGATVYQEPISMEKVGVVSIIADPQHAVFALFQPLPH